MEPKLCCARVPDVISVLDDLVAGSQHLLLHPQPAHLHHIAFLKGLCGENKVGQLDKYSFKYVYIAEFY